MATQHRLSSRREAELLALLCGSVVTITTNITMLGPLLLQLADDFNVSLGEAGLLMTATALPWALAAPILGPLSDRLGRRRVLAASLAGLGLATIVGALATSYLAMTIVRIASGLLASSGPISVMASVGDHVPASHRASALGWINAGFGISALLGVPLMGWIGGVYHWQAAFVTIGSLTLLLALLVWCRLPESGSTGHQPAGFRTAYRSVLRERGLLPILLANVLERSVFATVGGFAAAFLMQAYDLSLVAVAPLLALAALGTIGGNIVGGRLADRLSKPRVYAAGQVLSALFGVLFFGLPLGLIASLLLCLTFALLNAASRPAIIAMATSLSSEHRGAAIGVFSLTNQIGWASGPAASGIAYSLAGFPAIGLLCGLAAAGASLVTLPLIRTPGAPDPPGNTARQS